MVNVNYHEHSKKTKSKVTSDNGSSGGRISGSSSGSVIVDNGNICGGDIRREGLNIRQLQQRKLSDNTTNNKKKPYHFFQLSR